MLIVVQCALYKREITPEYEVSVIRNLVIAVLAARLQVQFVDAPVLKVVTEGHDAHVLDQVQSTCPVEVEYRCERPACPTHGIQQGDSDGIPFHIYTVVHKNGDIILMVISLSNLNRFSKFFHYLISQEICSKMVTKNPTTLGTCWHTTL